MTTFLLFIRMLLALGFVLGLLYVCSRIARRFQSRGVLPGARSAAGSAGRAPRIAGRGAPTSRKMAFARAGRLPRVQRTAAD
ncbi:MAG: hypothetical protein JWM85_2175, partial [Acidimicrobiaceae bacterium]|nr:hypothetical protein [Acidimicrobiaceae bacterium]